MGVTYTKTPHLPFLPRFIPFTLLSLLNTYRLEVPTVNFKLGVILDMWRQNKKENKGNTISPQACCFRVPLYHFKANLYLYGLFCRYQCLHFYSSPSLS